MFTFFFLLSIEMKYHNFLPNACLQYVNIIYSSTKSGIFNSKVYLVLVKIVNGKSSSDEDYLQRERL